MGGRLNGTALLTTTALALVSLAACSQIGDGVGGAAGSGGSTGGGGGFGGTASGAGGTGGAGTTSTGGSGGAGASLPCDAGYALSPDPPETGSLLDVAFSDPDALVFVDLLASGPGSASISWAGMSSSDPYTWNWQVTDLTPGLWTFTFVAGDPPQPLASCERQVIDTGPPPPPPPDGCEGKYCGDDDGLGGICEDSPCRVVGSMLANPSPCGPSAQDSPWQTLDSAGCESGNSCRIWCPYEKCSGCPNGTEAVWVPTTETSYESACKNACEGLGACWDAQLSLCRNPGACGQPLGECPWQ